MEWLNWLKENKNQVWLVVGLGLLAYINVWGAGFVADDLPGIVNNPEIKNFSQVWQNPMVILGKLEYFVISNLFGLVSFAFRFGNVLAHIGVSLLVMWLGERLINKRVGVMAGVLTAVHPLMIESVTWISGGGYVKYSFWLLLALILYIKAESGNKWLWWSSLAYLFSLQYSEKAMVLPAILIMYRLVFAKKRNRWWDLVPFVGLAGIWIASSFLQVDARLGYLQTDYSGGGAKLNPLIQIPVAITEYLKLVFWPNMLTLYHSEMAFSRTNFIVRGVVVGAMTLTGLWGLIKSFKGNKTWGRVSFWLGWLVVALAPTLTSLGVSWIVAERYGYLGVIGIFMLVAMLVDWLANKKGWFDGVMIAFGILVMLLMSRTLVRNSNWQTADKLWLSAARTSPNSPQNNNNLGDYYGRMGDLRRAEEHFLRAIKINPNYADAMHNLANTYLQMGQFEKAKEYYQKALKSRPSLWQSEEQLKRLEEYLEK
ncbi:MAG: tetratricopeptide repeat protein [Candidatus Beckwithbacteria bacterium]|nr:tetratricopeptide repeat protein [Patescibacteria group bacterium]